MSFSSSGFWEKFEGGKRHGTGIFTDDVGNKGIGEFRDGEDWNTKIYDKNGKLFLTYVNGVEKGVDEEKTGVLFLQRNTNGNWTWKEWGNEKTDVKYEGDIVKGIPNGQGIETLNEFKYVGQYKDGKKNGQGTFNFSNGSKYVGEWKDGERHGQGTYTYPDGEKWIGEFRDGKDWNTITYDKNGNILGRYVYGVKKTNKELRVKIEEKVEKQVFKKLK